jgi:hypothetical protein
MGMLSMFAPALWASVSACTSPTALSTFLPPDIASGCAYVDNSFTNFAVNAVPQQSGNTSNISFVSNAAVGDTLTSTAGQGVADFSSPSWTTTDGTTQPITFLQFVVEANSGSTIGGYTYTNGVNGYVTPAAQPWAVTSVSFDLQGAATTSSGTPGGAFIFLTMDICLNDTTLSRTGSCTPEGGSDAVRIVFVAENGASGLSPITGECIGPGSNISDCSAANGFTVSPNDLKITYTPPGGGVQALSIGENIALTSGAGDSSLTVNNLINEFGEESETPEPASIALFAGGLAALALLAARAKMRAS